MIDELVSFLTSSIFGPTVQIYGAISMAYIGTSSLVLESLRSSSAIASASTHASTIDILPMLAIQPILRWTV